MFALISWLKHLIKNSQLETSHMMDGEKLTLLPSSSTKRKQDYFVAIIYVLSSFGEGVESYLPGVITQYVSCDIGIGAIKEGFLGNIFFLTVAIGVLLGGRIASKIGERKLLLASLYLCCISTIACAVVANYSTLLLSRALIGLCTGLSFINGVFTAKFCSNPQIKERILFVGYLGFNVGGTYIAILGYLLLDYVGWRVFTLLTSIPIFLPPIFLLHSKFTSPDADEDVSEYSPKLELPDSEECWKKTKRSWTACLKIVKLAHYKFALLYTGRGTVLLIPSLIKAFHASQVIEVTDPCETITNGSDFLILAVVTAFSIIGRATGYYSRNSPHFRVFLVIPSALLAISYAAMMLQMDSMIAIIISGAVAKFTYAHSQMITGFMYLDKRYFKHTGMTLAIGSTIPMGFGAMGTFVGSTVAAFASAYIGVVVALAFSIVVFFIAAFMPETFYIEN